MGEPLSDYVAQAVGLRPSTDDVIFGRSTRECSQESITDLSLCHSSVAQASACESFSLWAKSYDSAPNPLLALEMRILPDRLGPLRGLRILDAGSGTGRWMSYARSAGAHVFGADACHEMVLHAEDKPGLRGRSIVADVRAIPARDDAFDLALCSFTVGYLPSIGGAFRELARVARRIIVTDLHPEAVHAGWTRSFRAQDRVHELVHYEHGPFELDACARDSRLILDWRVEARFDEPERHIFASAGKQGAFERVREVPAVLMTAWSRT